jgi:hypothetical protein
MIEYTKRAMEFIDESHRIERVVEFTERGIEFIERVHLL